MLAEDSLPLREGIVRLLAEAGAEILAAVGDGAALDPEVVIALLSHRRRRDPLASLSPREREVLALMAEGRTNTAIALQLAVSLGAVEKHVTSIFTKLGRPPSDDDHRRVLAVVTWLRA